MEAVAALNCVLTFLKLFKYLEPVETLALFTQTLQVHAAAHASSPVRPALLTFAFQRLPRHSVLRPQWSYPASWPCLR